MSAMEKLNEKQQAFVLALFEAPGNQTQAARRAGYTGSGIGVAASRMMRNEKIIAAIREVAEQQPVDLLPLAAHQMTAIVRDRKHPDHFKAVKHTQALAGLSAVTKVEVVHKTDTESLKAELLAAMELLRSVAGPQLLEEPTP